MQVVAWQVDAANTARLRVNDPLVGGIDGQFGRHGGCQLRIDQSGALVIGTGDAALGTNPQNPHSLAGKTLRVDRFTGGGLPGNPFFGNAAAGDPRIETLGHRNVQGLALQPGTGIVWSAEHGPDRDDEINQLSTARTTAGTRSTRPCRLQRIGPDDGPQHPRRAGRGVGVRLSDAGDEWRDVPARQRMGLVAGRARREHAEGFGIADLLR